MKNLIGLFCFSLFIAFHLNAQRISLRNPSFEDTPAHSTTPRHWVNCGSPGESPPDVFPERQFVFGVNTPPYAGNTYLGLVTRDNNTWEAVAANLTEPLEANVCYRFSIAIARSPEYRSFSRATGREANYSDLTRLRIWGSNGNCQQEELLAESPMVEHNDWQVYTFIIKPLKNSYASIMLEAFYPDNLLKPTNGHLLLDAASAFERLPNCELEGFAMPELSKSSEVVNISGESNKTSPGTKDIVALKLPEASYFNNEEILRSFAANALNDLVFDERNELEINQFQLAGETQIRKGHPAWYALQHALQFYPDRKWELVIYADDKLEQDLRVMELGRQLAGITNISLLVSAYDAEKHDGLSWFCMSVGNGLYLRLL
ncbi:hypothetical protein [Lewinella sp. LCG006]|uniref:hypothetical protein n=1 Tax=Lewinella sp. LCG006 TaxID=3231911 RepID=UPI003461057B